MTWDLTTSGDLTLNFKIHYSIDRVNSIRYSQAGKVVSFAGSETDLLDENVGYLFTLDPPYSQFFGFFGYEKDDGSLSGVGSTSINRKAFDDTVLFIDETYEALADAKGRLALLRTNIDNDYVANDQLVQAAKSEYDLADAALAQATKELTDAD